MKNVGVLLLVAAGVAFFVLTSVPGADVLPEGTFSWLPDLPDVPVWAKWLWRSAMIALVALAVIGEIEKARKRSGESGD